MAEPAGRTTVEVYSYQSRSSAVGNISDLLSDNDKPDAKP